MMTDSIWRFKKDSYIILLTGFFGASFQLWTIALAIYYARALEKGKIINLFGYEFQTRTSIILIFLLGMGVLFSLLLSAGLIYFSRIKTIALMRRYEEFCIKRILFLFDSCTKIWVPPDQGFGNNRTIFRLVRTDSRNNGRVLGALFVVFSTIITLLMSVSILSYINIYLTCLMFVFFGISSFFQYRINIAGIRNSTLMENYTRDAMLEYNQIVNRQKCISIPLSWDELWFERKIFSAGKIKQYIEAYIGRLKAVENSQFISNVLFAITIFVLLLALGIRIIIKGDNWSNLIVFLIALRVVLVNLKQISKQITSINRFYPQVKRYFQFIKHTETPAKNEYLHPACYTVIANNPIEDSLKSWQLCGGNRLGLLSSIQLNRYTLAFIVNCLLGHSKHEEKNALGSIWFMTSNYGNIFGSLREFLQIPPHYSWHNLREELEGTDLWVRLEEQLPHDLEKPVSREKWNQIEPDLKAALALLNAIHSNKRWVIIEENALQFLSDITLRHFMNRLSDRIVVVVFYHNTKIPERYGMDVIAVLSGSNIIGLGTIEWFAKNQHKFSEISEQFSTDSITKSIKDLDDEDMFDDEDV